MQQILIKLWCNRCFATQALYVEAAETRTVSYEGDKGRLDLCASCAGTYDSLLKPWLKMADPEDAQPTARAGFTAGSAESRAFYSRLRAWADGEGRTPEYMITHWEATLAHGAKTGYRYPDRLVRDYEAYLAGQARAA